MKRCHVNNRVMRVSGGGTLHKALALVTFMTAAALSGATFDDTFLDKTMRVDYFHTGSQGKEIVALDHVVSDGPWPGSRTRLVDETNLGKYFFDVLDRDTNRLIYS